MQSCCGPRPDEKGVVPQIGLAPDFRAKGCLIAAFTLLRAYCFGRESMSIKENCLFAWQYNRRGCLLDRHHPMILCQATTALVQAHSIALIGFTPPY
jgi:hypothetical protein